MEVNQEAIDAAVREIESDPKVTAISSAKTRKFATVKFLSKKKIIYRFDLWTTGEFDENGHKLVRLKNIINNFNQILPSGPSEFKDFFATVGLIRYVFPKTAFPMDNNLKEETLIVTLENNINEYISAAKLKNLSISIDPVEEEEPEVVEDLQEEKEDIRPGGMEAIGE